MVYTVVLNASYEVKSCLLLNDFMFSCCFYEFSNNFLGPRVDVNRGGLEVQVSNIESMLSMAQWVWMAPVKKNETFVT